MGEELLIPGPSGQLELLTSYPECYNDSHPIVVICHPHPLYGGSLQNKVVHTLAKTFNDLGLLSITFNFCGVEKSNGQFDHGIGETDDLLAVVKLFQQRHPGAPIWLAGFSFGAYVALRGHVDAAAERLLLVAPPVKMFDFEETPNVEIPWTVIQGGRDEVTPPEAVAEWVESQPNRPDFRWLTTADHFFHGQLNRIRQSLIDQWGSMKASPNAEHDAA
ncbi:hypothetical protein BOW53_08785 [Solemya pervernicosa gill symbiont]|uniref:KANL3/Tex30 alpha/beta hydrolase-like domain-containing protein n=1 Tax=Solemya pervernicosa gill symbiont TaxID=642797 RepID=A0A1T2L4Y6_9GAMM|nr:hypothetical protein BOW53_08785 [Solemya pervernicosa gill symbiont]